VSAIDSIESYTLIWTGIFMGMALAALIFTLVAPMPRSWFADFAITFTVAAFATRPFMAMLVLS
jgi:hypothetical protein